VIADLRRSSSNRPGSRQWDPTSARRHIVEVPGRDVTADPLGPDPVGPEPDETPTRDDDEGILDKAREAAEKLKDAATPDHRDR
jgi:hypothetical protein